VRCQPGLHFGIGQQSKQRGDPRQIVQDLG
jgi:hypothetical protein